MILIHRVISQYFSYVPEAHCQLNKATRVQFSRCVFLAEHVQELDFIVLYTRVTEFSNLVTEGVHVFGFFFHINSTVVNGQLFLMLAKIRGKKSFLQP